MRAELFTRLGLYVERRFLDPDSCLALADAMHTVAAKPATVAEGSAGDVVDEEHRRTTMAQLLPDLRSSHPRAAP